MWMITSLLSLIFPPTCIGCGKHTTALCGRCIQLARKSLSVPHAYITSTFDFKDPLIKRAVHAIKYHHRRDLITPLASSLAAELRTLPELKSYVLIPIPMPRVRKLMRGYNQAELLACELSRLLGLEVRTDLLARSKSPRRQATIMTKPDRLKNQSGSFTALKTVAGKHLILVDDVTTTGATLEEAKKTLLQSGASRILAATLAH